MTTFAAVNVEAAADSDEKSRFERIAERREVAR